MSSYCFKPQSWWYFCRRHHISFYSSLYYILFRSRISTWYFALVVPQLGDPLLANWILCCCQVKKRRLGVQEIHWQRCVEKWNIYIVTGQQQRSAPLCWLIMFHLSNACHWNWYSLNGVHLAGGYLEGHHIQRDPVSSWGGEREMSSMLSMCSSRNVQGEKLGGNLPLGTYFKSYILGGDWQHPRRGAAGPWYGFPNQLAILGIYIYNFLAPLSPWCQ